MKSGHSCRFCLPLCLLMLRDHLYACFFRPLCEPSSSSAHQQNKQGVICNGANHFTPGGAKRLENRQSRKPGSDREWHLRASEWASSSGEPPPECKSWVRRRFGRPVKFSQGKAADYLQKSSCICKHKHLRFASVASGDVRNLAEYLLPVWFFVWLL